MPPRYRSGVLAVALAGLTLTAAGPVLSGPIPDGVPDRGPVLSEPIARGELVVAEPTTRPVSRKTVDGDADDWVGTASRVGGGTVFDRGEHIYSDFLFDAHGADDGGDRDRLKRFAGLLYAEERSWRVDQVLRTSGSQLGVPEPIGAPDAYGDVGGGLDVGDLTEVRLGAGRGRLQLLVRVANLTDRADLGVLVLADTAAGGGGDVGLGSGLTTERFDRAVLLTADGVVGRDITGDRERPSLGAAARVAVSAIGWENTVEASLPLAQLRADGPDGQVVDLAVVTGRVHDGGFTPLNAAYRHGEPVEIYNDRLQALDLLEGSVDRFSSGPVPIDDLTGGRTQPMLHPGPGYHELQLTSDAAISTESGRDGIRQPYGVYVPSSFDPGEATPVTYWLHYRGGKAHSGTVINPRLTTQLGEEPGHLVVFPHGRGTSEWYVAESHQDVLEVMTDAESMFTVDDTRRYVSGYSMGGYGSWLFAGLYPDRFAAAFVQSGAVTQGAWLGGGPDDEPDPFFGQGYVEANGGDARAQLTYRVLDNLRHVPFAIDHGTNDELVPITGLERMAARLTELGYAHRFTRLLGYEHFTQAVMDEWADGASYLSSHVIDPDPRRVTYAVVPVLTWAINHVDPPAGATFDFRPDGAYWVDDIVAREDGVETPGDRPADDVSAIVDATSFAIPAEPTVPVVDAGVASPPGHSTPYLRSGLRHVAVPPGTVGGGVVDNRLELSLANVADVSVDVARTGLDRGQAIDLRIDTDGGTAIRLVGALADGAVAPTVDVEGVHVEADGDDLIVRAAAGQHVIVLPPLTS